MYEFGFNFDEVSRMTLSQIEFLLAGLKEYVGGIKQRRRGALKPLRIL